MLSINLSENNYIDNFLKQWTQDKALKKFKGRTLKFMNININTDTQTQTHNIYIYIYIYLYLFIYSNIIPQANKITDYTQKTTIALSLQYMFRINLVQLQLLVYTKIG